MVVHPDDRLDARDGHDTMVGRLVMKDGPVEMVKHILDRMDGPDLVACAAAAMAAGVIPVGAGLCRGAGQAEAQAEGQCPDRWYYHTHVIHPTQNAAGSLTTFATISTRNRRSSTESLKR